MCRISEFAETEERKHANDSPTGTSAVSFQIAELAKHEPASTEAVGKRKVRRKRKDCAVAKQPDKAAKRVDSHAKLDNAAAKQHHILTFSHQRRETANDRNVEARG